MSVKPFRPNPGTIPARILEYVRDHPDLDDDELSARLGIRPRQSVNQAARLLESAGLIERRIGSRGKIVNRVTGNMR